MGFSTYTCTWLLTSLACILLLLKEAGALGKLPVATSYVLSMTCLRPDPAAAALEICPIIQLHACTGELTSGQSSMPCHAVHGARVISWVHEEVQTCMHLAKLGRYSMFDLVLEHKLKCAPEHPCMDSVVAREDIMWFTKQSSLGYASQALLMRPLLDVQGMMETGLYSFVTTLWFWRTSRFDACSRVYTV